jgi:hypothetical protein
MQRLLFSGSVFPSCLFFSFLRCSFFERYHRSLLKFARAEQDPNTVTVNPDSSKVFSLPLSLSSGGGWYFYVTGSCSICSFFSRIGGCSPLPNDRSIIHCQPLDIPDFASRRPALGFPWGSCKSVLLFRDVIALLCSTLLCRLRLPTSFSGMAAASRRDPLFPLFLHGAAVQPSWAALLSGLLAQPWTWCNHSGRRFTYAMTLLHDGSSSAGCDQFLLPGCTSSLS